MKLYISADLEGVTGVVDVHQCFPGNPAFERARINWIAEINAVVAGALAAGVTKVVVNEAHALMNYLDPALLHPEVSYISGYVKPNNQMEGLDESFSGAVILGHAKAGTPNAILNHSYVMRDVFDIRLNGVSIGEFGLNAYWAAYYGVPTILIVGDDMFQAEAESLIPGIEAAVVKRGISQFTAESLPLPQAHQLIQEKTHSAVRRCNEITPPKLADRFELEIDFSIAEIAHLCSFIPGVERVGGRTIRFCSDDFLQAMQVRIVCTNLALATVRPRFSR